MKRKREDKSNSFLNQTRNILDLTNTDEMYFPIHVTEMKKEIHPSLSILNKNLPDDLWISLILNLNPKDFLSTLLTNQKLAQRFQRVFEKQLKLRYPDFLPPNRLCGFGTNDAEFCGVKHEVKYKGQKINCLPYCKSFVEKWLLPFTYAITKTSPMTLEFRAHDQKRLRRPDCDFRVNLFLWNFNLIVNSYPDLEMQITFTPSSPYWVVFTWAKGENWNEEKKREWDYRKEMGGIAWKFTKTFSSFQEASDLIKTFLEKTKQDEKTQERDFDFRFYASTRNQINHRNRTAQMIQLPTQEIGPCLDMNPLWWIRPLSLVDISILFEVSIFQILENGSSIGLDYHFKMKLP